MLKAYVKLNVIIHLEDESENPTSNGDLKDPVVAKARIEADIRRSISKYPLSDSEMGVKRVVDLKEAQTLLESVLQEAFVQTGVSKLSGSHKPDLSAAFGGCPENKSGAV